MGIGLRPPSTTMRGRHAGPGGAARRLRQNGPFGSRRRYHVNGVILAAPVPAGNLFLSRRPSPSVVRDLVCFDLDGTLLDPNGSIRQTLDRVVVDAGFAPFSQDEVLIGMPLRDILRLRTSDADAVEAMTRAYRRIYNQDTWRLVSYYPGMRELVQALRAEGMHTAIVTTKGEEEAKQLMRDLGDERLFDTVVGDDDVRPLKPDPAPVIAACGRLTRHPRDACMVGDTTFDMEAGRKAGTYTIGVAWGHGQYASLGAAGAHQVVPDVAALHTSIQEWRAGRHKP